MDPLATATTWFADADRTKVATLQNAYEEGRDWISKDGPKEDEQLIFTRSNGETQLLAYFSAGFAAPSFNKKGDRMAYRPKDGRMIPPSYGSDDEITVMVLKHWREVVDAETKRGLYRIEFVQTGKANVCRPVLFSFMELVAGNGKVRTIKMPAIFFIDDLCAATAISHGAIELGVKDNEECMVFIQTPHRFNVHLINE